jgi:hypothetical protein
MDAMSLRLGLGGFVMCGKVVRSPRESSNTEREAAARARPQSIAFVSDKNMGEGARQQLREAVALSVLQDRSCCRSRWRREGEKERPARGAGPGRSCLLAAVGSAPRTTPGQRRERRAIARGCRGASADGARAAAAVAIHACAAAADIGGSGCRLCRRSPRGAIAPRSCRRRHSRSCTGRGRAWKPSRSHAGRCRAVIPAHAAAAQLLLQLRTPLVVPGAGARGIWGGGWATGAVPTHASSSASSSPRARHQPTTTLAFSWPPPQRQAVLPGPG